MILYARYNLKIGLNENGTVYVQCPYCQHEPMIAGSYLSRHMKYAHPEIYKDTKLAAREAARREAREAPGVLNER